MCAISAWEKTRIAVTGASRGIGLELCLRLGQLGCRVFSCARTRPPVDGHSVHTCLDVRSEEAVLRWADTIAAAEQRLDVLVNNAGVLGRRAVVRDLASSEWNEVLETNVVGTATVTRHLLPLLLSGVDPLVINVGSIAGYRARVGFTMYAVSKCALACLTEALAQEVALDGVRVVQVLPPRVDTGLRRRGYVDEPPQPRKNLEVTVHAIERLIARRTQCVSGVTLFCDDVEFLDAL